MEATPTSLAASWRIGGSTDLATVLVVLVWGVRHQKSGLKQAFPTLRFPPVRSRVGLGELLFGAFFYCRAFRMFVLHFSLPEIRSEPNFPKIITEGTGLPKTGGMLSKPIHNDQS
ncbi:hypothetical protein ACH5RR_015319 [Cinchona calisaya]|uniref:Uncharacterized protein n=1 Tax=Cinchona calisaya TaxID=153742 RepID=A0ABD2ZSR9_9GENT